MLNMFIHANHKTELITSASPRLRHPPANSRLDLYATDTQTAAEPQGARWPETRLRTNAAHLTHTKLSNIQLNGYGWSHRWGVGPAPGEMRSHDQSCRFTDADLRLNQQSWGVSNSPVRSWTRCGPVSARSILGSTPSVAGPARLASDLPEPPSAGAARGCPPRPTWGTRPPWKRTGWTGPLGGCSTCSPGRPGSKGRCSFPETAP